MEFTSMKQTPFNTAKTTLTLTILAVFLTILFLGSCAEEITAPPGPSPDYMSFTLTNASGTEIDPTTPLSRGSTYGLVITSTNNAPIPTADYTITYTPDTAITGIATNTNSVDFKVNSVGEVTVFFTVAHRIASAVSETFALNLVAPVVTAFGQEIENTTTVPNLSTANQLIRYALTPLAVATGVILVKRYATETGAGNRGGTSWTNAWAGTSLRNNINAISDASANKVYLVMVAGGTYKPGTSRGDSFSMKNYVAIMGGFEAGGGWGRTGTTMFSGDIGAAGNGDNSYHVFNHNRIPLGNAHLYGVTITNGNANGSSVPQNTGGGMYNVSSSPVLTEVVFSGNSAGYGGGMYNNSLSPVLTRVMFSGNTTANQGGGMYNTGSSPVLTGVVFSGNSATGTANDNGGGGMYNTGSSPVIIGAVFRNNRAANGGAMFNDNGSTQTGPLIVNTIFSGNTTSVGTGYGPDIAVNRGGVNTGTENIRIAGSVLGLGLPAPAQPTNAIVGYNGTTAVNITYHSLAKTAVSFGANATTGGLTYPTITAGSSAINLGLYVRRNGSTYYFSETEAETSWHTDFTSTGSLAGTAGNLPTTGTIEDITATDIAGNSRNSRPDAGVYEVQ